jgi:hypothetical protein
MGLSSSGNYCYKSTGGYWAFYKETGELIRESSFNYSGGLIGLIDSNSKITDVITITCQECGNLINEGNEVIYYDGEVIVCSRCSDRYQRTCFSCGETGLSQHQNWYDVGDGNEIICEYCREDYYSYCPKCEKLYHNDDLISSGDGADSLCEECIVEDETLFICHDCDKYFLIEEMGFKDEYSELTEICKPCYKKFIEKNQLKFNFSYKMSNGEERTEFVHIENTTQVDKNTILI